MNAKNNFDKNPFLTGAWKDLIIINYKCPSEILEKFIPNDVELDLWNGEGMFSLVAFTFSKAKMHGIKSLFHQNFGEINFRCYVKSKITHKRGVVFLKELAAKRFMAFIAHHVYNEPFFYFPIKREVDKTKENEIKYSFQTNSGAGILKASKINDFQFPENNSLEHFIVERYSAFVKRKDNSSREYLIKHVPWKMKTLTDFSIPKNLSKLLVEIPEKYFLKPVSSYLVDGSDVGIYKSIKPVVSKSDPSHFSWFSNTLRFLFER